MNLVRKIFLTIKLCLLVISLYFLVGTESGGNYKLSSGNMNLSIDLTTMAFRVEEDIKNDIYSAKETYSGDLTGYGADCPLCSGRLACMPSLDVMNGNITYNDSTYGEVRIVASSSNLSCGTIIAFQADHVSSEKVYAIVLDRGVLGTALDLLDVNSNNARYIGRTYITYDVLRRGW